MTPTRARGCILPRLRFFLGGDTDSGPDQPREPSALDLIGLVDIRKVRPRREHLPQSISLRVTRVQSRSTGVSATKAYDNTAIAAAPGGLAIWLQLSARGCPDHWHSRCSPRGPGGTSPCAVAMSQVPES